MLAGVFSATNPALKVLLDPGFLKALAATVLLIITQRSRFVPRLKWNPNEAHDFLMVALGCIGAADLFVTLVCEIIFGMETTALSPRLELIPYALALVFIVTIELMTHKSPMEENDGPKKRRPKA